MLLENWDKYMAGPKGEEYIEKFWRPKSEDFALPAAAQASGSQQLEGDKKEA